MRIRGVLFDTGNTLTRPVGGRWNPRFDFRGSAPAASSRCSRRAVHARLPRRAAFPRCKREYAPRDEYHRVILGSLGISDPSADLLEELNRPLDVPAIESFPEVRGVLSKLRALGLRMAIVTDNWGTAESVKRMHDLIGLGGYFDEFVVSEELGCNKPDPRIFVRRVMHSSFNRPSVSSSTTIPVSSQPRSPSDTREQRSAETWISDQTAFLRSEVSMNSSTPSRHAPETRPLLRGWGG